MLESKSTRQSAEHSETVSERGRGEWEKKGKEKRKGGGRDKEEGRR